MKRLLTATLIAAGSVILAGCTLFGTKSEDGIVTVETTATTFTGAKDECLSLGHQWNESETRCERPDNKTMCLMGDNQWNEKTDSCEFSKVNCLSAHHQRNEEEAVCEYTKEECLAMSAQRDEQSSKCEIMPETIEKRVTQCLDDGHQWDYSTDTCQSEDHQTGEPANPDQSVSSDDKTKGYTLAEVKVHATETSCWAAINGKVYDLTSRIAKHPGGPDKIKSICGTEASAVFNGKHGGMEQPETMLATFQIGTVAE